MVEPTILEARKMIARQPLTDLHNGAHQARKIQRTYGKKGKASAALQSARDIFTMPSISTDLEEKLELLTMKDDGEAVEEEELTEQPRIDRSKEADRAATPLVPPPKARRTTGKCPRNQKANEATGNSPPQRLTPKLAEDDIAIQAFITQFSDREVLSFETYGNTIAKKYDIKKIGEGTYSNVFSLTYRDDSANSTPSSSQYSSSTKTSTRQRHHHKTTILKLLPILLPSREKQIYQDHELTEGLTSLPNLTSELSTLSLLDPHHGFIRYRSTLLLRGSWAPSFLSAFRSYSLSHPKKAENADPEDVFGPEQLYCVVEMEDAGVELSDAYRRPSDFVIWDIFWQTAIHLAVAEEYVRFEHRDLHVSNICVKGKLDVGEETVKWMEKRPERLLGFTGVGVTIIDYTFSRVDLPASTATTGGSKTNFRAFEVEGAEYDALCQEIQMGRKGWKPTRSGEEFESRVQQLTYAKVAKCVELACQQKCSTSKSAEALWECYVPKSNVAWLGYLVTCLLSRAGKMAKTKYVAGSSDVAKEVQDEIRAKLCNIRDLLMIESIEDMLGSAGEVVRIGVERGWLTIDEIEAFKTRLEEES